MTPSPLRIESRCGAWYLLANEGFCPRKENPTHDLGRLSMRSRAILRHPAQWLPPLTVLVALIVGLGFWIRAFLQATNDPLRACAMARPTSSRLLFRVQLDSTIDRIHAGNISTAMKNEIPGVEPIVLSKYR